MVFTPEKFPASVYHAPTFRSTLCLWQNPRTHLNHHLTLASIALLLVFGLIVIRQAVLPTRALSIL